MISLEDDGSYVVRHGQWMGRYSTEQEAVEATTPIEDPVHPALQLIRRVALAMCRHDVPAHLVEGFSQFYLRMGLVQLYEDRAKVAITEHCRIV